jgi:hypothetical protein
MPHGQPLAPGAQLGNQPQFAQAPEHVQFWPLLETMVPGTYDRQFSGE